ncbi:(Fe-S)-binding protein, partial [Paenibacillus chitinolyticus]|uniref:(Fe-S)-binding protein n=1 Tax=Paenibacillus chitinolyticus TaxID=79263 RepID=UPI002DB5C484
RPSAASADASAAAPSVRITYQDSCHLRNVMRSSDAPRKLMRQVAGVEYVEMFEADRCCGSAGIYNLTQPDMANQILDHKMVHANATDAGYLLTSNPGCLLQMKLGNERHGDGSMKVMHVVDFLHERMLGDR